MNSRLLQYMSLVIVSGALVAGCSDNDQNSNVQVFKTARQLVEDRRLKQVESHRDLAMSILRSTRSDITVTPKNDPAPATAPTASAGQATTAPVAVPINSKILLQADGQSMVVDLLPVEQELEMHANQERTIVKQYLDKQLRLFDTQWAVAMGFDRSKPMLAYELASVTTVGELEKGILPNHLFATQIVGDMHKMVMIQRGELKLPVTDAVAKAWHTTREDIESAAMANLKTGAQSVLAAPELMIDTLPYGSAGRTGTLKSNVDPAIILLPEFLKAVQAHWMMQDNLVIEALAPAALVFVEEHNQVLLDRLYPQWKGQLVRATNPLCRELILRDDLKLGYANFKPTTKPSTAPATKPRTIYIH